MTNIGQCHSEGNERYIGNNNRCGADANGCRHDAAFPTDGYYSPAAFRRCTLMRLRRRAFAPNRSIGSHSFIYFIRTKSALIWSATIRSRNF